MREDEGMCLLLKEWFDSASGSPVGLRTIYLLAWDSVRQLRIAMSEQGSDKQPNHVQCLGERRGTSYCYSFISNKVYFPSVLENKPLR